MRRAVVLINSVAAYWEKVTIKQVIPNDSIEIAAEGSLAHYR